IYTLKEIEEMGYDPLTLRYALLAVPHRTKLNFTEQSLIDAKNALARIQSFLVRLEEISKSGPHDAKQSDGHADQLIGKFLTDFETAMDDDLNTSAALAAIFVLIRDANVAIDAGRITPNDAEGIRTALMRIDPVLDIFPRRDDALDQSVEKLIDARNAARRARNFAESDRIRDELLSKGILLEDTPGGTRWRRK
ncbi:MAG TPA: DALR domain-containing protein, partial [Thermoanaerobaculia bacterium]|nr:DALR domain-containing protein [Thermoanaerobaculia bacterium]